MQLHLSPRHWGKATYRGIHIEIGVTANRRERHGQVALSIRHLHLKELPASTLQEVLQGHTRLQIGELAIGVHSDRVLRRRGVCGYDDVEDRICEHR